MSEVRFLAPMGTKISGGDIVAITVTAFHRLTCILIERRRILIFNLSTKHIEALDGAFHRKLGARLS